MSEKPLRRSTRSTLTPCSPSNSRRTFLGTTLAAAGGFLAGSGSADAFSLFRSRSNLDTSRLPREWVARQGNELHAYARYLSSLRLRHMGVEEIVAAHAKRKGSVWNTIPPRSYWRNMKRTLQVADEVASRLGSSVRVVTSAYRSPAYNARCRGAMPNSFHKQNFALDLQFHASPWTVARVARSVREEGKFRGGVGRYSSFTHIDTRGYNADW